MSDIPNGPLATDLEILAELFAGSGWRELRVQGDGLSLLLSQDRSTAPLGGAEGPTALSATESPAVPVSGPAAEKTAMAPPLPPPADAGAVDPAWTAITAPNLGTFYRSPKPGSPPFVEIGQKVQANTEVCLIEVMKLFTSVQAGGAGMVRSIAVADGELVEGGQPLIYIERD